MTPDEAAAVITADLEGRGLALRVVADRELPARVTLDVTGAADAVASARGRIAELRRRGRLGTLTIERWPTEEIAPGEQRDRFEIANIVTGGA